jgi:predicted nucleic acid-binding protein
VTSFVLDTNVVVALLDGRPSARHLLDGHDARPSNCGISPITRIELLGYPGLLSVDDVKIRAFLTAITLLPLDELVETHAIALRSKRRLSLPDAIVVATAIANGRILLTFDEQLETAFARAIRDA